MKYLKRTAAGFLCTLLTLNMMPYTAAAAEANTPKEEVVYVTLNHDGTVSEINVVNIFELDEAGTITDYGAYSDLRNMTTTDTIDYTADVVNIHTQAGKLYYEGKLNDTVIPWNIAIRYYMDGKEYTAKEIAGMNGKLKITLTITENEQCADSFFEGYALQTSLQLDTEKCKNIVAEGATLANVGKNKQLTYTILPGNGADVEITADVTDFSMEGISLNGVKLNLNIAIDDDMIQNIIDKIVGAVTELDNGADKLKNGAQELADGTALLEEKTGELHDGIGKLVDGTAALNTGLNAITEKNEELLNGAQSAFKGICTAVETVLNAELTKNGIPAVTLTIDNYAAVLEQLMQSMNVDNIYQQAYNTALAKVTEQVEMRANEVYAGYVEANEDMIIRTYLQSQSKALYAQVVSQKVLEQLIALGSTQEQATAYLETPAGQGMIDQTIGTLTEEQKQQILDGAAQSITQEQKNQIKTGAAAALTDEQKTAIKNGYIDQTMKSAEVTSQINAAMESVDNAGSRIAELKGQLDNYSLFYEGLRTYTTAVSEAANGADTLHSNMDTLYSNVGTMKTSVGELNNGVSSLRDGVLELKDGTSAFAAEVNGMETEIGTLVDSMIDSATGSDTEIISFVSDKNTNIEAVQFVIKTGAIHTEAPAEINAVEEEPLNFWQKLLQLFGL